MDPITAIKIWTMVKPIKRIKLARKRRKAKKAAKRLDIPYFDPIVTDEQTEDEMKEFLAKKAAGAIKSSTVGVAGVIVAAGVWMQANPEIIGAVVPDGFEGVALAVIGLLVAIARLRTAGN